MVLYGVEDHAGGLRGEIAVAQHPGSHRHRTPDVVGALSQRVGPIKPDVVQEGREAQYLCVVVEPLLAGELLCQGVHPQAVGVAPDRVCTRPRNECLYLLDDYPHRYGSVADALWGREREELNDEPPRPRGAARL